MNKNIYIIVEIHSKRFDVCRRSAGSGNRFVSVCQCSNLWKAEEVSARLNFADNHEIVTGNINIDIDSDKIKKVFRNIKIKLES